MNAVMKLAPRSFIRLAKSETGLVICVILSMTLERDDELGEDHTDHH